MAGNKKNEEKVIGRQSYEIFRNLEHLCRPPGPVSRRMLNFAAWGADPLAAVSLPVKIIF